LRKVEEGIEKAAMEVTMAMVEAKGAVAMKEAPRIGVIEAATESP
jgi:hypothetical protein